MEKKIAGILLIILVLSLELNSTLLIRVSAQPEELAKKLEEYLGKAIPEDLLAEECEYVAPEGFNLTLAERLWRDFSLYVSTGCTTSELRSEVKKIYGNSSLIEATLSNGETIGLNVSGVSVERSLEDGSVSVRIPIVSSTSLNYSRYNFTKQAGFYEAWNKTLVREYRVWRREQGWYKYTMRFLETNNTVTIVSKIWGREALQNFSGIERVEWTPETGEIPIVTHVYYGGSIMVAIPGHYEDVRTVVPEQRKSFKVLFPAYDPAIIEGWVITTSISSTSLSVGETLEIAYSAEYSGGEPEPLNATLTLSAPEAFEPLNSLERRLDDTHTSGFFRLKAVKPGTYNLTLTLIGNASFSGTLGNELTYEVQVVSPPAPSLSVTILGVNTSVLKHAGLTLSLANNGGSAARNIRVEITGTSWEVVEVGAIQNVSRSMGDIEAGETRVEEFVLRLLRSSARITVKTTYSEGNPYLVKTYTTIYHPSFWVPEHFETYTTIVPEHEETMRVFIPGYEHATHVRLYALWDPYIVGAVLPYMCSGWVYEAREPVWGVGVPTHVPSLGLDSMPIPGIGVELPFEEGEEALTGAGVKIMVTSIEPHYEYLGVFKEDEVLRLVNASKGLLKSGNISPDYRVEPLKPYWVEGEPIVLNATQLALYQAMMDGLKKTNPDIDYEYREAVVDVRTRVGEAEPGYLILIYHPLKVVGEGPLKSVRMRNFARIGFNYRVDVETSLLTVFGKTRGENSWKHLFLGGKEDAVLLSSTLDQVYDREVAVNITLNGRLVAKARFILKHESSPYWKGFWDGLASQAWKIAITVGLMVIVGFIVPAQHVKTASYILLAAGVVMNLWEVAADIQNAYAARDFMNSLAAECVNKSKEYMSKNMPEHAREYIELARRYREAANETIDNLGINALSNLFIDVGWDEVCVALEWKEPVVLPGENRDYKIGYARGRVAGTIIHSLTYVVFFTIMIGRIKAERVMGQPLSTGQILRLMGRGLYNWITPAVWDATILAIQRKGAVLFGKAADLLLANKYSKRFGDAVGSLLQDAGGELPRAGDTLDASSEISKQVLENVPSRESSSRILDAIGSIVENYSPEEMEAKGKPIVRSIVSMWSKDGDKAIDSLNSWLSVNSKDLDKMNGLDEILVEIQREATKGVGLKIGEIADNYINIKGKHGEEVANAFLNTVLKNPDSLDSLIAKVNGMKCYEIDYGAEPRKVTLSRGEGVTLSLGSGRELEPGTYKAKLYWEGGGKSGTMEFAFSKDAKTVHVWIPKGCVDEILGEIGSDETTVSVTNVRFFEYVPELYHPTRFFTGGAEVMLDLINSRIVAYDEFDGVTGLTIESGLLRTEEGKAILEVTTRARNMQGKPLALAFYDDGVVKIRLGDCVYPIASVKVSMGRWIVEYPLDGKMHTSTNIVGKPINVPEKLMLAEDVGNVEDRQGEVIKLKERIFLSGYYVETLDGVGNENIKERLLLKVYFSDDGGNYRISYCCNPRLAVEVPEGMTRIEHIEVLKYLDTINNLDECIQMSEQDPSDTILKGQVGELIVRTDETIVSKLFRYRDEISEKTGISKDKISIWWHEWAGDKGPDFKFIVTEDVIDKHGNLIKAESAIAVGEIKSTSTHRVDIFERGINNGKEELIRFLGDIKTAKYGILVVLDYDVDNPSSSKPYTLPPGIGSYENPYIEIIERK